MLVTWTTLNSLSNNPNNLWRFILPGTEHKVGDTVVLSTIGGVTETFTIEEIEYYSNISEISGKVVINPAQEVSGSLSLVLLTL